MQYTKTPQEFYEFLTNQINEIDRIQKQEIRTTAEHLSDHHRKEVFKEVLDCCLKETYTKTQQIENIKKQAEFIKNAANEIANMEWE